MVNQHSGNLTSGHSSDPSAAAELSRAGRISAAVLLGFILVLGFLGNFLILLVFSRFPRLRTPTSLLLMNITWSDLLVCIFGTPLSFAASVRGRWLTGSYGCQWYGFSNALFGKWRIRKLSRVTGWALIQWYPASSWGVLTVLKRPRARHSLFCETVKKRNKLMIKKKKSKNSLFVFSYKTHLNTKTYNKNLSVPKGAKMLLI